LHFSNTGTKIRINSAGFDGITEVGIFAKFSDKEFIYSYD